MVYIRIKLHMDLQADKSPRHSQGTLLPLSVRTQSIESVKQCAMQVFNLVKKGKLSLKNQVASNLLDHQENTCNLSTKEVARESKEITNQESLDHA
jgi:hypothetical protein